MTPYHFSERTNISRATRQTNYRENGKGFIALMSAIIISAVLLMIAVTGSLTGFFERSNILDSELKDRSAAAADACADQAFLLIANDPYYTDTAVFSLNSLDSCRVVVRGSYPNIRIQATSSTAVTNLQIQYSTTTFSVITWQEIPVF